MSASIWLWHRDGGDWKILKVIEIPAEPADESVLPPALKPFKAVPPLITDINLSLDDKFLYVACFGTGDLKQYDVSDPFKPKETGSVRLCVRHDPAQPHRARLFRLERIAHVILLQIAGAEARDVQKFVVETQIDIGNQRRHRLERLERGRQHLSSAGSAGISITLRIFQSPPSRCHSQIDADKSLVEITTPTKP